MPPPPCPSLPQALARGAAPGLRSLVLASPLVGGPYPRQPDGAPGHYVWGAPGSAYYTASVARGAGKSACVAAAARQDRDPKALGAGAAPNAAVQALVAALEQYDAAPGLRAARAAQVPVLVTRGADGDPCDAGRAESIAEAAGGRVQSFANAAHLPHVDAKEEYLAALTAFVAAAEPAPPEVDNGPDPLTRGNLYTSLWGNIPRAS